MTLKGVLIDFGNTLAHVDEEGNRLYKEALMSILRKHGHKPSFDTLETTLSRTYGVSTKGELKTLHEFWSLFLMNLKIPPQEALTEDLEETRRHLLTGAFKLYEGVLPMLPFLQKKYRLALVSNCAVGMIDVMKGLGLPKFFDNMTLSYEVEVRKPDRRIFVEAFQALGLRADECVFVADEISDLEGAREVGMLTILVRQGSNMLCEAKDPNFRPDFQCDRISQITIFL